MLTIIFNTVYRSMCVCSLPVLSMILPVALDLPNMTSNLSFLSDKLISKLSSPSNRLSAITDILTLVLFSPTANIVVIGLESKSTPDPITVQ